MTTDRAPFGGSEDASLRQAASRAVERLRDRPLQVFSHSRMLSDTRRLAAYRSAIRAMVQPDSTVVDIGAGTGILASYAAERTRSLVYALEIDPAAASLARKVLGLSGFSNIQVVESASFARPIDAEPSVLVTETLGNVGVEEHIVETCWEFGRTYPSVRTVIPGTLTVLCQPFRSNCFAAWCDDVVRRIMSASWERLEFRHVEDDLREALSLTLVDPVIEDALAVGPPFQVAHYVLGQTRTSRCSAEFSVPSSCDGVHLYFEANLGAGEVLLTGMTIRGIPVKFTGEERVS